MQSIPVRSLEIYGFADLAAGKDAREKKRRHARQVVVVGGRDWLNRWFWLHVWAGYLTATKFKDKILSVQEEYEPRRFGLEANGMQVLFGSLVREEARVRFGRIKMMAIYQPTNVEKNYRIRTGLEPVILQGRFFLQKKEIEARTELSGFPTAATKDIVDAMEACISQVAPKRQVKLAVNQEKEEYARYLRASGMASHLIEREMERFGSSQVANGN